MRPTRRDVLKTAAAVTALGAGTLQSTLPAHAQAELKEINFSRQPGVLYLPMILMEHHKLVEKHAKLLGLGDVKVNWLTLTSGGAATDALLAGSLDFVTSGATNMLLLWDRTKGQVKGVAGCGGLPMFLLTNNPNVKTIKDFTAKDKIAVPTIKVSSQATILHMAAEKAFGPGKHGELDAFTVQMGHPDATAAIMSPNNEINSHFSLPPFQQIALKDPKVHVVLRSDEIFGGPVNNAVTFTSAKFRNANPKGVAAVLAAIEEAMGMIKAQPKESAVTYLANVKDKITAEEIVEVITAKGASFGAAPVGLNQLSAFMARVGTLKTSPKDWKEFFWEEAHGLPGN
jgi:NitT/TauT family transport system substrate-binding protein